MHLILPGVMAYNQGDYLRTIAYHKVILTLGLGLGDREIIAECLAGLARRSPPRGEKLGA